MMATDGYTTLTVPDEVVDEIDTHKAHIGASSRAEAIRDLVRAKPNDELERQLAAIESELKAMQADTNDGFVEYVKDLEMKISNVENELNEIRNEMEARA